MNRSYPSSEGGAEALPVSEAAWLDVIRQMDETYSGLIDYQVELEQKNSALEAMRQFVASVLESMTDILIVCDRSGGVIQLNRVASRLAGLPEAVPDNVAITDLFAAQSHDTLNAMLRRAGQLGSLMPEELILRSEGGEAPFEVLASPRRDARGRSLGTVLIGRPVGELRLAYQALNAAHDQLKAAQAQLVNAEKMASLGRLVSGVAHELNNPISFVYGNAHALERYVDRMETYFEAVNSGASREALIALRQHLKLDKTVLRLRDAATGALEGAERVRDIVEQLRRFSGTGHAPVEPFDLTATVQMAVGWVTRGQRPDLSIDWDMPAHLSVTGRSGHIQQVVMNIIQNAVDATEGQADPHIRIELVSEGDVAALRISDNGPGLSEDVRSKLFEPFFTTKPVGKGTGLGMSISYRIVQEHGGELIAGNAAGGGALFEVRLPIKGGADVA